jgi:hypothetical protein
MVVGPFVRVLCSAIVARIACALVILLAFALVAALKPPAKAASSSAMQPALATPGPAVLPIVPRPGPAPTPLSVDEWIALGRG